MEYEEARQLLADVDNLTDDVAVAEQTLEAISGDRDRIKARLERVKDEVAEAKANLEAVRERLHAAEEAAVSVPEEHAAAAAADLAARQAAKAHYNEALAIAKQLGRDRAAVEGGTGAAANVAGAVGNGG